MSRLTESLSAGPAALEEAWLDALPGGPDPAEAVEVLSALLSSGSGELASALLELALDEMERASSPALPALVKGAAGLFAKHEALRRQLLETLRDEHLMLGPLELFIARSGLDDPEAVLSESWERMRGMLRLAGGTWILHRVQGPGRLVRLTRETAVVAFPDRTADIPVRALADESEHLPDDSVAVLGMTDPQGFRRLLEDPASLLGRLLDECGGVLERSRASLLLGAAAQQAWKQMREAARSARGLVESSERIERLGTGSLEKTARDVLSLRSPLSARVRELAALLQAAPHDEAAAAAGCLAADPAPVRSVEAGAAFELDWLLATTSGADPSTVLRGRTDPSPGRALQALSEISAPRCRRLYLELWAASSGTAELEELLPQLGHSQRQMLLDAAGASHPGWPQACLQRLAGASEDPDLRLWAASMLLEKAGDDDPDAGSLVRTLLEVLPRGRSESQRRAARALVDRAVSLRSHLASLDRRRLTQLSVQLGDIGQVHESGLFLEIGRELSGRSAETFAGRAFWESDYVFDDPSAIRRRAEAIEQLRTVEIPAAAASVGEAASHGDLSENAEYKAALERRDLLLERLSRWTDEYARLRPYPAADLAASVASPGTAVVLTAPGGELVITLTGPLEARPEEGRVNYLAPLGRALLGRTVGEELELPGREGVFRVAAIELAPEARA